MRKNTAIQIINYKHNSQLSGILLRKKQNLEPFSIEESNECFRT